LTTNVGPLAEQFVAQELISFTPYNASPSLFYWHRETKSAKAEVDFIIPKEEKILPIEVKSGSTCSLKSLHRFLEDKKKSACKYGVRISTHPLRSYKHIKSIPFYALSFLYDNTL
jgi:uncharacterized protein